MERNNAPYFSLGETNGYYAGSSGGTKVDSGRHLRIRIDDLFYLCLILEIIMLYYE